MGLLESLWKVLEHLPVVEALRDGRVRRYEHDRQKFQELEAIMPEEALDAFLEDNFQLSIRNQTLNPVSEYLVWQSRLGNHFIVSGINKRHRAFAESLLRLKNYSASQFAPADDINDLFTFQPAPGAYDTGKMHIENLVREVDDAYKQFRQYVKKRLQV